MKQSSTAEITRAQLRRIILASGIGTVIEWYDFFIFGSLAATVIGPQFFPKSDNPLVQTLEALATFAVGFVVRPFGALVFGKLGDTVGRKYTFLVTLLLMGGSTFAVAFVPNYAQIGLIAPMILVLLRLVQGLALGGEYGGATTYVAEHTPDTRRGFYTSLIQLTATIGLVLSIAIIFTCRTLLSPDEFQEWGWRIPFVLSGLLVIVSYFIRQNMDESPLFNQLKTTNTVSKNPLKESFVNPQNRRLVLLTLFGLTAGYGCIWYTAHFYPSVFIGTIMHVDFLQTNQIMLVAIMLATPFAVFFGSLSDKRGIAWISRKKLMMTGLALASITFYPIYRQMATAIETSGKVVAQSTVSNGIEAGKTVRSETRTFTDGSSEVITQVLNDPSARPKTVIHLNSSSRNRLILWVFLQVFIVAMAYGPIAAYLVELFPTRIRYTSLSLPYHIGNGIFGGLTPFIATALISSTGNQFAGLLYPLGMAAVTTLIGLFRLPESTGTME